MVYTKTIQLNGIFTNYTTKWYITIIIILSCHQHGYPWPSLATPPYRSSLPASLQGYTPNQHRAAVCRFELVALPLHDHVKGSTGIHHLWARPCFSSSVHKIYYEIVYTQTILTNYICTNQNSFLRMRHIKFFEILRYKRITKFQKDQT